MKRILDLVKRQIDYLVPGDAEIQVGAFNILAVCGMVVSITTSIVNAVAGNDPVVVLADCAGAVVSLVLIVYCHRSGNYKMAMTITAFIVFLGLLTALYFIQGGYHSGIPAFFIFGIVFTAFLLDGAAMVILVFLELVWYIFLILYSYYHPQTLNYDEKYYMVRVILDMTLVALSLAITMYCQIRIYRKKQQELNVAVLAADEANRAKSDFLAKMSHDIRTPLNTIMATNELIVENTSSAKIREWVNDSNISSRILMSLIDDMLDLTKIEAGRMDFLEEPWDTAKLFGETAKMFRMQAERTGLGFHYDLKSEVPEILIGDEDVIRKIASNLLSNSVKYTRSGSISFTVGMEGRDLLITVSDTGIGIAPEHIDTIFKPFERGAQKIYRETSGSGLGLAIVKELVDALQGSIECESVVDYGSTFRVRLPQKEASDRMGGVRPETGERTGSSEDNSQFIAPDARILVVDDNPSNRKVITSFLEPALIRIDDVESGYEALEMLDIKEYDLVLMDLRMPKMDGVETLSKIREEYPGFSAPVVVLTADIMTGVKDRLLDSGFSDFLSKPVSSSSLLGIVRKYIPGKIIKMDLQPENSLTLSKVEGYQERLLPYGIDLKMALEVNSGSTDEFLMRSELFEQYADETVSALEKPESQDSFYLQLHSIKSIARGVGAYLLAQLAETAELRRDYEYSKEIRGIMTAEYDRVRKGLRMLKEEEG